MNQYTTIDDTDYCAECGDVVRFNICPCGNDVTHENEKVQA